jgi:hypothetical protein
MQDSSSDGIQTVIESCVDTYKKQNDKAKKDRAAVLLLDLLSASQSRLPVHPIFFN